LGEGGIAQCVATPEQLNNMTKPRLSRFRARSVDPDYHSTY